MKYFYYISLPASAAVGRQKVTQRRYRASDNINYNQINYYMKSCSYIV